MQQNPQQQGQFVTIQPGQQQPVQYVQQGAPPGAQVVSLVQQQPGVLQQPQGVPMQQQQQQQQQPQHVQMVQAPPPQPRSTNSPQVGEDPRNLIVNYIPTPVTDHELRQLFEQYGDLESARVICDRVTAHPKGYGFVKYKDEAGARAAMENMNGFEIYNKRLKVTTAKGPHNAAINNHTQRLQNVVQNTPPTMMVANPQHPQGGAGVQYVLVDNNMQPIQGGGRQMGGSIAPPRDGHFQHQHQHQHQQQVQQHQHQHHQHQMQQGQQQHPIQMFQIPPNAVALGPGNDPMYRDSCQLTNMSQYNSFTASPQGLSTGQLSAAVAAAQQQQQQQQVMPQQQGGMPQQQQQQQQ